MVAQPDDRATSVPIGEAPVNPAETYERYMVPALFAPAAGIARRGAAPARRAGIGHRNRHRHRRPARGTECRTDWVGRGARCQPGHAQHRRAMASEEGLNIDWDEGQAEALPYPDECFDLVLSQFALMFLPTEPAR